MIKFFWRFLEFWLDLPVLGGFYHKDTKAQSFDFPYLYALLAFEKMLKAGFIFVFNGSRKDAKAQSLLFISLKR